MFLITEITTHPSVRTTVIALQDITLSCSASVEDVAYSWHRVDGHIPSHSQGRYNDTLTILGATPRDQGTYYCMAVKSGISIKSNDAIVQVDGKESCSMWLHSATRHFLHVVI